jgi:predicted nicotinamide N-methyase
MSSHPTLHTTAGDVRLGECRLAVGGRTFAVRYTAAVVTRVDEARYLAEGAGGLPYGVALWPAAIALAHEIVTRPDEFRNRTVLEVGAGTGLPGVVAAVSGAAVVQTDRQELALHLCRLNGERNRAAGVEYRLADWAAWDDEKKYDWIIGADVLYADTNHPHLRAIFESNLKPDGRVLLADPYRADSLPLLEGMEAAGWRVTHSRWSIGEGTDARPIAVYELSRPGKAGGGGGL